MKQFFLRRLVMALVTVVIVAGILSWLRTTDEQLGYGSFWSGYLLLAAIFFLALFNWRKKLSFLPLGAASAWLQLHIYVALATVPIFLHHVGWRWPNGILETALFSLYALTTLSGLVGLYWTRRLPRRLNKLRQEVIYEQIPIFRRQVQLAAHVAVMDLLSNGPAAAIADYYTAELIPYFVKKRGPFYYLFPSGVVRNRLQGGLNALTRYCSEREKTTQQQLRELVDQRDDLDYHEAQQRKLKLWLFVHLGLTCALLLVAVWHALLAHVFSGRV